MLPEQIESMTDEALYDLVVNHSGDQLITAIALKYLQRAKVAEEANKAMTEAIKAMFQEPQIKAFYETHRDMDSMFANEVPKYKEDCESITKAFNACIDAIKLGELK